MKKIIKWMLSLLPKRYIVFESVPDLSDNTKAVFDEMIQRGLHKKYKFVWDVDDKTAWDRRYPNTVYMDTKTFWHRLQYYRYRALAKCLISCNRFLGSRDSRQTSFYLTHGTPIKSVRSYYTIPSSVDYLLTAAESTNELMAYELNFDIQKTYALGFPRNDVFSAEPLDVKAFFEGDFTKTVIWYPTFRQHRGGYKTASTDALPILETREEAERINEYARARGVLILIKPHFAQDVSYIKQYDLSHIRFIDDAFYRDHEITSYQFIGSCDALITDYSSVYFDYLLTGKPIAVVWSDIEEYKKRPGFAIDLDFYLKGAEKIYTMDDFETFIDHLADGFDPLSGEREEISAITNYAKDGQNAKRVVDFIVEKAKL